MTHIRDSQIAREGAPGEEDSRAFQTPNTSRERTQNTTHKDHTVLECHEHT